MPVGNVKMEIGVPSDIGTNLISLSAMVSAEGPFTASEKGICRSTSHNPTFNDDKVVKGAGPGPLIVTISGLSRALLTTRRFSFPVRKVLPVMVRR